MVSSRKAATGPRRTDLFDHIVSAAAFHRDKSLFRRGGVYALWIGKACWYVGKADHDMAHRLTNHLQTYPVFTDADQSKIKVGAHPCRHPSLDECAYIFLLRPRLNKETKGLYVP